jgi:hypothetical protein
MSARSARSARSANALNATRPRMNATRPIASAPPLSPVVMNVNDLASAPPQLPEDIALEQYQLMVHQVAMAAHNNYLSILNLQRDVEDIKNSLTTLGRLLPYAEV